MMVHCKMFLLLGITADNSFNKHGVLFSGSVQIVSHENFLMLESYALKMNHVCWNKYGSVLP